VNKKKERITPVDIEKKLVEVRKEITTVPGVLSLLKKASPSLVTLIGLWARNITQKKSSNKASALIEIQMFPKIRKYFFKPSAKAVMKIGKSATKDSEAQSES